MSIIYIYFQIQVTGKYSTAMCYCFTERVIYVEKEHLRIINIRMSYICAIVHCCASLCKAERFPIFSLFSPTVVSVAAKWEELGED